LAQDLTVLVSYCVGSYITSPGLVRVLVPVALVGEVRGPVRTVVVVSAPESRVVLGEIATGVVL